ncbi:hypothetical protein KCU92_g337, partial [Aureobasidium melanogenum]
MSTGLVDVVCGCFLISPSSTFVQPKPVGCRLATILDSIPIALIRASLRQIALLAYTRSGDVEALPPVGSQDFEQSKQRVSTTEVGDARLESISVLAPISGFAVSLGLSLLLLLRWWLLHAHVDLPTIDLVFDALTQTSLDMDTMCSIASLAFSLGRALLGLCLLLSSGDGLDTSVFVDGDVDVLDGTVVVLLSWAHLRTRGRRLRKKKRHRRPVALVFRVSIASKTLLLGLVGLEELLARASMTSVDTFATRQTRPQN